MNVGTVSATSPLLPIKKMGDAKLGRGWEVEAPGGLPGGDPLGKLPPRQSLLVHGEQAGGARTPCSLLWR